MLSKPHKIVKLHLRYLQFLQRFSNSLSYIRYGDSANCDAVAFSLTTAALVTFQQHQPSQPPT